MKYMFIKRCFHYMKHKKMFFANLIWGHNKNWKALFDNLERVIEYYGNIR